MPKIADKPIDVEALRLLALLAEDPNPELVACPDCGRPCHPTAEEDEYFCAFCGTTF